MAKKLLIPLASFLSLLLVANYVEAHIELVTNNPQAFKGQKHSQGHLHQARQCRLHRISASQPSRRIQSEGGVTEFWDEYEDQFQCTGVAAMRNIIQPNSLSLPNYSPAPRLVYVEQGRGLVGLTFPGCALTYQSSRGEQSYRGSEQEEGGRSRGDEHQKVLRVNQGDLLAIPAGVPHWCLNDGNEDLVAVSVTDLNNEANQLDQKFRSYYLAGGQNRESQRGSQGQQEQEGERGSQGQQGQQEQQGEKGSQGQQDGEWERETYQNILRNFDENLIAEALNVNVETVRKIQKEDGRGYIVKVREDMSVIHPDEEGEEYEQEGRERPSPRARETEGRGGRGGNGLEETLCTLRIHHHMDDRREADVYSRHAGRLNIVNELKLPILSYLDLSAEKGNLLPNAIHTPHWTMNAHSIFYVTRGEGRVQAVGNNGQRVLDEEVREGHIFAVPQYFASMIKAGKNGLEWVAFKTSSLPIKNPLAGSTSVFRAMPAQVIAQSYGLKIQEALNLKYGREEQTLLLPPGRRSSY